VTRLLFRLVGNLNRGASPPDEIGSGPAAGVALSGCNSLVAQLLGE
jgi:hypothetical protein